MAPLSNQEIDQKTCLHSKLAQILRDEEMKWYQRAKSNELLQGDSNTKYFQLVATGKHRKARIFQLKDGVHTIQGEEALKKHITAYYKVLFGPPDPSAVELDENQVSDIPQVSDLENSFLTCQFTEEEIRRALFQMEHNRAPGPDGFPAEFFQVFWSVIKNDLLALFEDFHKGDLSLYSLNFGTIILLPKCRDAEIIQQYRPICLLNVSFKIFTKVLTNRISTVASKTVGPTQSAFIPGRNIMEGVVVLHETIHELHRNKQSGVIFKIDFEKAYDKVKWSFIQQTLRMKGFSNTWCEWIDFIMTGGHVGIKVNDQIGPYFQTHKGLRQGDPLSPILFNVVVDMLAILINRAKADGQVDGLVPHLVDGGLSILQYADDTLLFFDNDVEKAANLKSLLVAFEQVSGLKINYHKSELFCFGKAIKEEHQYQQIFGCKKGGIRLNT